MSIGCILRATRLDIEINLHLYILNFTVICMLFHISTPQDTAGGTTGSSRLAQETPASPKTCPPQASLGDRSSATLIPHNLGFPTTIRPTILDRIPIVRTPTQLTASETITNYLPLLHTELIIADTCIRSVRLQAEIDSAGAARPESGRIADRMSMECRYCSKTFSKGEHLRVSGTRYIAGVKLTCRTEARA
jgi:hypothetical protein